MKKFLFLIFVSLFLINSSFAEISIKVNAPSAVAVGQRFKVEYSVNDKATEIRVDFNGSNLDVLYGPSSGSMYKNVNGVKSISSTFTYTLVAKVEGSLTIPAATIIVGGEPYTSKTVNLKVLSEDQSGGGSYSAKNSEKNGKVNADDVHLELVLSRGSAYVGEAIVATLKLYFRNTPIHSISDAKLPDFDGFTVQDMDLGTPEATLEKYKNANYSMYPIKQWLLFPSRSGDITIPSSYITAIAQVVTRSSSGGWFDFPMDYTTNVEVPLSSAKKTVKVSPLPAGKPASFSNGVGDFKISANVTSTKIRANDALIYRITIDGVGNLKYMNDPEPQFPSDFEVYDPKVNLNSRTTAQGALGKKVVEYTIIPRHAGTYEIPSVEYSFFNVKTGQYVTLNTEPFTIEVEKGVGGDSDGQGSVSNYSGSNQERLKVLGNDVRYIHKLEPEELTDSQTEILFGTYKYWLCYIIPVLILIILAIVYRRQLKLNSNADLRRTRKANKVAVKRLKEAAIALKEKNQNNFYEAIHKAMFGYASDKLSIKLSELTTSKVKEQLILHGVSEELIAQYEDIVSTCEFARYAPSQDAQAMDQLFKKAGDCLNSLESQIKK